jgi:hypothetical protein
MLNEERTQIIHLNPVKINYELMKWEEGQPIPTHYDSGDVGGSLPFMGQNGADVWDGVSFATRRRFNSEFLRGLGELYIRFRLLFSKPKKKPIEVFMKIKDTLSELEPDGKKSDEEIKGMLEALEKSKQKAAIKSIIKHQSIKSLEDKLVAAGITQYQTEESIIKFIKQCKKGLCLTEIEKFERNIPEDVMVKFDAAEVTRVFDNYLILYYDPKKIDNRYYTAEKDPILFGVIKGSDKLHYIADWVDEFCNLTYADILKSKKATDFKLK